MSMHRAQDEIARRVAARLGDDAGLGLQAAVERNLSEKEATRPGTYEPASAIALAALVVGVAQLGWTVYADLRGRTPSPRRHVIERTIRLELRNHPEGDRAGFDSAPVDRLITLTVDEIIAMDADTG